MRVKPNKEVFHYFNSLFSHKFIRNNY